MMHTIQLITMPLSIASPIKRSICFAIDELVAEIEPSGIFQDFRENQTEQCEIRGFLEIDEMLSIERARVCGYYIMMFKSGFRNQSQLFFLNVYSLHASIPVEL